jgi:4-hydroxy-tetrahydrodipicolinate synthase
MGGKGVISVLSNVLPEKTVGMCDKFFAGDLKGAAKMQCDLLPLIHALFSEVNPIPVKAAMAAMGFCENRLRLPLTEMEEAHREKLFAEMRRQGVKI